VCEKEKLDELRLRAEQLADELERLNREIERLRQSLATKPVDKTGPRKPPRPPGDGPVSTGPPDG
jgi:hypothetical protein